MDKTLFHHCDFHLSLLFLKILNYNVLVCLATTILVPLMKLVFPPVLVARGGLGFGAAGEEQEEGTGCPG